MSSTVPSARIRKANRSQLNRAGDYVLYWMMAFRRTEYNYSLQRAVEWCRELKKPLVILEALRCGYPWANDRLHRFIIEGMVDNAPSLKKRGVLYYPYLESYKGGGKGLLEALSEKACLIVTDDFPCFFIPRMIKAASKKIKIPLEAVDSNGVLPMNAGEREFKTAYSFRRFLQKVLPSHLHDSPLSNPVRRMPQVAEPSLPKKILSRWPALSKKDLLNSLKDLSPLPIDHTVGHAFFKGGRKEGLKRMHDFLDKGLPLYPARRNEPEMEGTSGLSPYLHFGHITAHEVLKGIFERESWFFDRLAPNVSGKRSGWWGMNKAAEAFVDELITWRELGFNMCHLRADYDRYESLPKWALETLYIHEMDERKYIYSLKQFESGGTHNPLWNAAQMQLVREGRIHNYLRMLWGKKILEWSPSPRRALKIMLELNNKYAVDGRDPNSYSGIFWILGRYDRAWGPERPVFGKIRYMSSKNTARKVGVKRYIEWYAP
jgi:deoxyribodipyrimidine photo-lyase